MQVRRAQSQGEVTAALALRERVFCVEQGVALEADRDGHDRHAVHLVAVEEGRVVGTCRLVFDPGIARLGRMAVEPELRGQGIGAEILRVAENEARAGTARRVRLHAQMAARSLYERGGYRALGQVFMEEGIEHVTMEKHLA
jgi:putative N-acetyltransferase (TIGR04045 family)